MNKIGIKTCRIMGLCFLILFIVTNTVEKRIATRVAEFDESEDGKNGVFVADAGAKQYGRQLIIVFTAIQRLRTQSCACITPQLSLFRALLPVFTR
jgi:hypothetical protein